MRIDRNLIEYRVDRELVKPGDDFYVAVSPPSIVPGGSDPSALALVVDMSPSMEDRSYDGGPSKWDVAIKGLRQTIRLLPTDCRLSVLRFDGNVTTVFDGTAGEATRTREVFAPMAEYTSPAGGTNIGDAINAGGEALATSSVPARRVILFTDGMPTVGERNQDALANRASAFTAQGIYFDAFGFGEDANDELLANVVGSMGMTEHVCNDSTDVSKIDVTIRKLIEWGLKTTCAGGEIELRIDPRFELVGVHRTYPQTRALPVPKHGKNGTELRLDLGAMGLGECRPMFMLRLKAPAMESPRPVRFMKARGTLHGPDGPIELNGLDIGEATVEITSDAQYYDPSLEQMMAGTELQMETDKEVAAARDSTTKVRAYEQAQRRAQEMGLTEHAESFSSAITKLRAGLHPDDVRSSQRVGSSKITTRPRDVLSREHPLEDEDIF